MGKQGAGLGEEAGCECRPPAPLSLLEGLLGGCFDHDGFDHDGFDHDGFDHDRFDHDGFDHDGLDHDGFDHDAPPGSGGCSGSGGCFANFGGEGLAGAPAPPDGGRARRASFAPSVHHHHRHAGAAAAAVTGALAVQLLGWLALGDVVRGLGGGSRALRAVVVGARAGVVDGGGGGGGGGYLGLLQLAVADAFPDGAFSADADGRGQGLGLLLLPAQGGGAVGVGVRAGSVSPPAVPAPAGSRAGAASFGAERAEDGKRAHRETTLLR